MANTDSLVQCKRNRKPCVAIPGTSSLLRGFVTEDANVKRLVNIYGVPGKETDLVKSWIAAHENWLLVMDNFDTISMNIDTFIPTNGRRRVIFCQVEVKQFCVVRSNWLCRSIEVLTSGYIVDRRRSREERKMKHADTGGSDR
jgi:hypothetical protein